MRLRVTVRNRRWSGSIHPCDEAINEVPVFVFVRVGGRGDAVALHLLEHHSPSWLERIGSLDLSSVVESDMGNVDERCCRRRGDHRRREPLRRKSELLQFFGSSGAGI